MQGAFQDVSQQKRGKNLHLNCTLAISGAPNREIFFQPIYSGTLSSWQPQESIFVFIRAGLVGCSRQGSHLMTSQNLAQSTPSPISHIQAGIAHFPFCCYGNNRRSLHSFKANRKELGCLAIQAASLKEAEARCQRSNRSLLRATTHSRYSCSKRHREWQVAVMLNNLREDLHAEEQQWHFWFIN